MSVLTDRAILEFMTNALRILALLLMGVIASAQTPPRGQDTILNFWGYGTGFVLSPSSEKLYAGATGHLEILSPEQPYLHRLKVEMFVESDSSFVTSRPPSPVSGTMRLRLIYTLPFPPQISLNLPDPVTGSPDGNGGHLDIFPRTTSVQGEISERAIWNATISGNDSWFWDQLIVVDVSSYDEPYFNARRVVWIIGIYP